VHSSLDEKEEEDGNKTGKGLAVATGEQKKERDLKDRELELKYGR